MTTTKVFLFRAEINVDPPLKAYFDAQIHWEVIVFDPPVVNGLLFDSKICDQCSLKECSCEERTTFKMNISSSDYLLFVSALDYWKSHGENFNVLVVKPTSVTGYDFNTIKTIIDDAFILKPDLQFFYLAKWLDDANQFENLKTYPGGLKLIRTYSPHGMQVLLLSVECMRKLKLAYDPATNPVVCRPFSQILHDLVSSSSLNAYSTTPLLFHYDATIIKEKVNSCNLKEQANLSYLKNCECQGTHLPEFPLNRRISSDVTFFWLFLLCIIVLLTYIILKNFKKN